MIRTIKVFSVLLLLGLTACETTGGTPSAVCNALVGPIRYNSADPRSTRFAGAKLAPDLAVRNRVGINLRCPEYR